MARKGAPKGDVQRTGSYTHPTARALLRPEIGTQAQFRKNRPKAQYRYDSSLSAALDWDGQNSAREEGEALIRQILEAQDLAGAKVAAEKLRALSKPFLDWAGKAERLSFNVPTLPLFIHERLSTRAILETLRGHKRDRQLNMFDLFGERGHSIHEQVLRAYEHPNGWLNRMILGDSLVVMNSLLHSLGGQVQMIYMDPPYGVKFGSNFQPFVRKRDVTHNDDGDMTREPEMVKAYRDTWELGLHSYLTYLRDRLLLCRELLAPTGSVFVQISDENLHHVREVMDEVFGAENFLVTIFLRKKGSQRGNEIRPINDHLLWFCKDKTRLKRRFIYDSKLDALDLSDEFDYAEFPDGTCRLTSSFSIEELGEILRQGARLYVPEPLTSGGEFRTQLYPVEIDGRMFRPPANNCWKFNETGMTRIQKAGRIHFGKNQIRFKKYHTDFPYRALSNLWADMAGATDKIYVVQTAAKAIQRCLLMTTDPGDLVLDSTCGSGTTAYVAEQWGRRWITIDTSRVPLALARQRLLTATFPYYSLKDSSQGPASGFVYVRRQNRKGEEVGGVVPHITSSTIANDEPPAEEVLVDRPEVDKGITRVSGPFCVEATIPTPADWEDGDPVGAGPRACPDEGEHRGSPPQNHVDRMLEVLRKSPVLHVGGGKQVTLQQVRSPVKTLTLSAEAMTGDDKPVAIVFGPENGAVSEKLAYEAAREAHAKSYSHLYVIAFAIEPNARKLVQECDAVVGVPATYVQATPDLMMGDLLKNMRASQIFSVCGLPEIAIRRVRMRTAPSPGTSSAVGEGNTRYEVQILGLDVFDPVTMELDQRKGDDVPAWFLDTDYNGLCFHVCQAFFPRTGAWDALKRALRGEFEDSIWDHLAGSVSAPFESGEHRQIAVKVIDDRGNELMVVKALGDAS
ncbi:MAG: site-specific DNA-methyltransferase [Gammaproteobacteria bacterium]